VKIIDDLGERSTLKTRKSAPVARPDHILSPRIVQFAKHYDSVPRHLDEEADSVFGGPTASSAHTFSIFILLTTRLQPRLQCISNILVARRPDVNGPTRLERMAVHDDRLAAVSCP
jgi:acyl dehydratase